MLATQAISAANGRANCFIAGGIRCGTTWLHAALAEHPEVCVSKIEKEIHYFDRHFEQGENWYNGYFSANINARWTVDATPAYLDAPHVAQRLQQFEPDARLIFMLRNPTQRAYSDYCRRLNHGQLSLDTDYELRPDAPLVKHGRYFEHLQTYCRYFHRDQMLILLYEDLERDPAALLQRVLQFLSLADFTPPNLHTRTNHTKPLKRWPLLHEGLRFCYHAALHLPMFGSLMFRLRSQNAFSFYHRLNRSASLTYPPFNMELQRRLIDYYRNDVAQLADWLQVDLSHWHLTQALK